MKIAAIVGTRPNFVKIAPIVAKLRTRPEAITTLIHTGQHYDGPMSDAFFANLELPDPDVNLHVKASSATAQIAEIMLRLEPVLAESRPDLVVVVGDVNSTLAGALTASKLGLRLAHVEAGLRSFDRTMPEEINRVLTDSISDLLFTTTAEQDKDFFMVEPMSLALCMWLDLQTPGTEFACTTARCC